MNINPNYTEKIEDGTIDNINRKVLFEMAKMGLI